MKRLVTFKGPGQTLVGIGLSWCGSTFVAMPVYYYEAGRRCPGVFLETRLVQTCLCHLVLGGYSHLVDTQRHPVCASRCIIPPPHIQAPWDH